MPTRSIPLPAGAHAALQAFYTRSSTDETRMMGGLIVSHRGLLAGMTAPRCSYPEAEGDELEKTTDALEEAFMMFREAVQTCPTFRSLSAQNRLRIERALFAVPMPPATGEPASHSAGAGPRVPVE